MTQEFGVATFGSAVGDSFIMPLPDREPVRRSDVLIIIICTLYQFSAKTLIESSVFSNNQPVKMDFVVTKECGGR